MVNQSHSLESLSILLLVLAWALNLESIHLNIYCRPSISLSVKLVLSIESLYGE